MMFEAQEISNAIGNTLQIDTQLNWVTQKKLCDGSTGICKNIWFTDSPMKNKFVAGIEDYTALFAPTAHAPLLDRTAQLGQTRFILEVPYLILRDEGLFFEDSQNKTCGPWSFDRKKYLCNYERAVSLCRDLKSWTEPYDSSDGAEWKVGKRARERVLCYTAPRITTRFNQPIFRVGDLLKAGGINLNDQTPRRDLSSTRTIRYAGASMVISLLYKDRSYFIPLKDTTAIFQVQWLQGARFQRTATELISTNFSSLDVGSRRLFSERRGLSIDFQAIGSLTELDLIHLLVQLGTLGTSMKMAQLLISTIVSLFLPKQPREYYKSKYLDIVPSHEVSGKYSKTEATRLNLELLGQ